MSKDEVVMSDIATEVSNNEQSRTGMSNDGW